MINFINWVSKIALYGSGTLLIFNWFNLINFSFAGCLWIFIISFITTCITGYIREDHKHEDFWI